MAKKKKKAAKKTRVDKQVAEQSEAPTTRDVNQLDSPSFRVFSGLVVLFFLAGLLAANDATSIWSGAEAQNLWNALSVEPTTWLGQFLHAAYDDGPLSIFYLRFFGIFFFLVSLVGSFFIGKRLFGKNTIWLALLLVAASLLLPNIAKRASTDIYLFSSQLLFGMSTLILLKSPRFLWHLIWLASFLLSFAFEPLGCLLFAIPFVFLLWRSHPDAKLLQDWRLWSFGILGAGLVFFLQGNSWVDEGISFAWFRSSYGEYLAWQTLAVFPFIGFVAGGIRDLFFKVKKREEFSSLLAAWILAALLAQSLTLSWVLALLAAKQMQLYFNPKYPFRSWVRGGAILQLVFAFFVLMGSMILGFWEFRGVGFRSLLAITGVYWGMGVLGVIGLYGFNHRLLIGGPILAGILGVFLFWQQFGDVLESRRHWNSEIVELAKEKQSENNPQPLLLFYPKDQMPFPATAVYGLDKMRAVNLLPTKEAVDSALAKSTGILVLEQSVMEALKITPSSDTLSGWDDRLEKVQYQVIAPQ